jgi:transposase
MYDVTKLVQQTVFDALMKILPTPRQQRRGRRRIAKQSVLNGVLQVLVNGVAWRKIAECGASPVSCWRYFHELQRRGNLKLLYDVLARTHTDIIEGAIDTTTATSFRFERMTG